MDCWSVFVHFVGLTLKGLILKAKFENLTKSSSGFPIVGLERQDLLPIVFLHATKSANTILQKHWKHESNGMLIL